MLITADMIFRALKAAGVFVEDRTDRIGNIVSPAHSHALIDDYVDLNEIATELNRIMTEEGPDRDK